MWLFTVLACSDYTLDGKIDIPAEDTGRADTADTGDTEALDSDTGVDTGGTVDTQDDSGPVATEPVYVNTGATLYSYDPTAHKTTKVGDFKAGGAPVTGMTDIAIDLAGHMYGCAYSTIYRIDPGTAAVVKVGDAAQSFNALTFLSDGRLVGAAYGTVSTVDTTTAKTSKLYSGGYTSSGDIVGLPDGMLYWSVEGGDTLVRIDPGTWKDQKIGSIGQSGVYGLGYAYGELLGFTSGGKALVIDATTAKVSSSASVPGVWYGATTNPVLW